jgi:hypothetical protein
MKRIYAYLNDIVLVMLDFDLRLSFSAANGKIFSVTFCMLAESKEFSFFTELTCKK